MTLGYSRVKCLLPCLCVFPIHLKGSGCVDHSPLLPLVRNHSPRRKVWDRCSKIIHSSVALYTLCLYFNVRYILVYTPITIFYFSVPELITSSNPFRSDSSSTVRSSFSSLVRRFLNTPSGNTHCLLTFTFPGHRRFPSMSLQESKSWSEVSPAELD